MISFGGKFFAQVHIPMIELFASTELGQDLQYIRGILFVKLRMDGAPLGNLPTFLTDPLIFVCSCVRCCWSV